MIQRAWRRISSSTTPPSPRLMTPRAGGFRLRGSDPRSSPPPTRFLILDADQRRPLPLDLRAPPRRRARAPCSCRTERALARALRPTEKLLQVAAIAAKLPLRYGAAGRRRDEPRGERAGRAGPRGRRPQGRIDHRGGRELPHRHNYRNGPTAAVAEVPMFKELRGSAAATTANRTAAVPQLTTPLRGCCGAAVVVSPCRRGKSCATLNRGNARSSELFWSPWGMGRRTFAVAAERARP